MSMSPPAIRQLARQLLSGEPTRVGAPEGDANRAARACEKLRAPLTRLAGPAGFASLLSRALTLAKRQVPLLEGLRVGADGSLVGFDEIQQGAADAAGHRGEVLLVELLGLLITLIGEPLTVRLLREAWPDASIGTVTLRAEEKP